MISPLSNYADHPNVGGVILIDLGCEKTNMVQVEKYLLKREKSFDKPVAKIGIQEVGGTQAAIQQGLKEVERMLPEANSSKREECSVSELILGVKCGGSDGVKYDHLRTHA
jgi:altronate hydrolase